MVFSISCGHSSRSAQRDPSRKSVFRISGMRIGDEYKNGPLGSEGSAVRSPARASRCSAVSVPKLKATGEAEIVAGKVQEKAGQIKKVLVI
jgi:hypothetical protein